MKIAIVDFDHYEMVYSLIKCLSPGAGVIDVYATAPILKTLRETGLTLPGQGGWIDTQDVSDFTRTFQKFDGYDFIFLNTVDAHFNELNALLDKIKGAKIILTIHNVNHWFTKNTRLRVFKKTRDAEHREMLKVLKKCHAFLVLSTNVAAYLRSKVKGRKSVLVFPFLIFEGIAETRKKKDGKIEIAIPGAIENKRKNYDFGLQAFTALRKDAFRLKLLGGPKGEYGHRIIEDCKKLRTAGFDIEWFDRYITPEEFEQQMASADLLFAPIHIYTHYRGVNETYGQSKETGAVFDLIRYAKPGVFPKELHITEALAGSVVRYSGIEELSSIFTRFTNREYLGRLSGKAVIASEKYLPEVVSKEFFAAIKSL